MSLLTGDELGLLKVVNLKSKTLAITCGSPSRESSIAAVCLVPTEASGTGIATSASRVAVVSHSGVLTVWDTVTGTKVHRCEAAGTDAVLIAAWKGNFIVVSRGGAVKIFTQGAHNGEGDDARTFDVGPRVCAAAFHQTTGTLAIGGREHEPELWDISSGERTWSARSVAPDSLDLRVPVWVTALVFIGEAVANKGKGGGGKGGKIASTTPTPTTTTTPAIDEDMDTTPHILSPFRFVVATGTRSLRFYDSRLSRRPLQVVDGIGEFPFSALALASNGRILVTGDTSGILRKFDALTLAPAGVFRGHTGAIRALVVHDKLPYVASVSLDRTARVYHVESRQLLRRFYLKQRLQVAIFAPTARGVLARAIQQPDGARPGAGLALRQEAAASWLTRKPEADDDDDGDNGEEKDKMNDGKEGGEDGDDEDVWEELQRRAQVVASGGGGGGDASGDASGAAPIAKRKRKA